jgi:putative NIF3 family GTP cyclohydrolase 1 type 2
MIDCRVLTEPSLPRPSWLGLATGPTVWQNPRMRVRDVIRRIADEVPFSSETVDNIKLGSDETPVERIVCAFMPTVGVLREAAQRGANLVIVHEPIFYNHTDETSWLAGDAVVAAKRAMVEAAGMTVFRFHDAPHRILPDMIREGVAQKIGWKAHQRAEGSPYFDLPETSVKELAAELRARLMIARPLRLVGDPTMRCSRIALVPGFGGGRDHIGHLADDAADVVVAGEGHEWEASEYVRDACALGRKKAIVYLGHTYSEDAGMEAFASWLAARLPGVAVSHVPTESPFAFV